MTSYHKPFCYKDKKKKKKTHFEEDFLILNFFIIYTFTLSKTFHLNMIVLISMKKEVMMTSSTSIPSCGVDPTSSGGARFKVKGYPKKISEKNYTIEIFLNGILGYLRNHLDPPMSTGVTRT